MITAGRHTRTMADDIPRDVKPPDLTVGWFDYWRRDGPHAWVPPMNGDVRGQAPPDGTTTPPKVPPVVSLFRVAPNSLESASKDILTSAAEAINAYNAVKSYMNANKS